MLKIVENLWTIGAPPHTPLGELTALPRPPSCCGGGLLPLHNNPTPAVGLRPRFSALRPSFVSLSQHGRSQRRRSRGAQASGRWAREWGEQMSPLPPRGSGGRDPGIFLYVFNTKSCILVHSLAPKMGTTSVFINTPMHWEMKTVARGCRRR